MKKILYLSIIVFLFVSLISCNNEVSNLEKNYNTPTAIGRIILPEGTGLNYSDIYVKVMETSAQYQVESDGTWVVSGLDADTEYTLYFQDSPFLDISRSLEKENDNGNHYGAKKDNVKGSTGSGFDNGIVQIKKTATVKGIVEVSDGSSLLGIDVYVPGTSFIAKTDENGNFSLSGIPDGRYQIVAEKYGYIPCYSDYITVLTDNNGDNVINLENNFILQPGYGTIHGSIVYEGNMGDTIPFASISIRNIQDPAKNVTVSTDGYGKYSAGDLVPGIYDVTIIPDSLYQSAYVEKVVVEAAKTTIIDPVTIKANGGTLKGYVKTYDDKSTLGASVLLVANSGAQRYTTQVDDEGVFIITNIIPGQYSCSIMMDGYSPNSTAVAIASAQTSELSCTLQLGVGAISGKVYLEGSEVYSGITVTAINTTDSSTKYSSTTLADGSFDILQIDIEGNYQLVVSKEGYVTDSYTMTSVKLGGISKIEDIVLKSVQATVSGNIILEGAASHEGVMLLLKNGEHSYQGTTDTQGAFSISGVVPGNYTLLASKGGYSSKETVSFTVVPSENKVLDNIILPIGIRSINGRVVLELATDHSGALVTATNLNESSLIYSAITNSNGDFSFAGMKPGEYMISISKTGYRSVTLETVNVVESSSITLDSVDVKIAKGYISGIAKLEGWTDYSGIKVELLGTDYVAETDSDGTYTFEVPSGNYPGGLRFSKEDFELTSHAKTITVLTDSTYGVEEYILTCQKASITGRVDVLGTDDESGVKVSLVGTEYSAVTGSDGTFTFDHVILGKYTLRLERENANIVNKTIELDPCPSLDVGICEVIPNSSSLTGYARLDGLTDHKGIKVTVKPQDASLAILETETDSNGYFYIGNVISTGTYDVIFSKEGWDSQEIGVSGLNPLEVRDITSDNPVTLEDTTAPVLASVVINSGANTTSNKDVVITVEAYDAGSGVSKMQYAFDGRIDETVTMREFVSRFDIELPKGNGDKELSLKVYDAAGNGSEIVLARIKLIDQKYEVKGILKGEDLHWTKAKSPYLMTNNVLVEEGYELVIDPGVDIQVEGDYSLVVKGRLAAIGTDSERIKFYGVDNGIGSWNGIQVQIDNNTEISYVDITETEYGISGYATVSNMNIEAGDYAIEQFRGSVSDAILVGKISASNTSFDHVEVVGDVHFDTSQLNNVSINGSFSSSFSVYTYCSFMNNDFIASSIDSYVFCDFDGVDFGDNWDKSFISYSNMVGCGMLTVSSNYNDFKELNFRENYWGPDKTREIEENKDGNLSFIYDYNDGIFDKSKVDYSEYQKEEIKGVGYQGDNFTPIDFTGKEYEIGDIGPAGGIIFFVDENDEYPDFDYMEMNAGYNGLGYYAFGYYRDSDNGTNSVVGTETGIGMGRNNTEKLVAAMGDVAYLEESGNKKGLYAAKKAYDYEQGGYADWFLPSKDELNLMYENIAVPNLCAMYVSIYLSSSEFNEIHACGQYFDAGSESSTYRSHDYPVRPCRAF